MPAPGIGHNRGPGFGWRRYAWARAELRPARVPLEIVRRRIRRAERLGLDYPQYASILLGSGRDIVGFLFTVGGMQARLLRRLELPDSVAAKLGRLTVRERLGLSPFDEPAAAFQKELEAAAGCAFAAVAPAPPPQASWSEMRRTVRAALKPLKLPADAVAMIGDDRLDPDLAAAAELAGYLPGRRYFAPLR